MEEGDIKILLEIDGATLSCNKQDLITNSDYFKTMFEGSFIEHDQNIIKLEGIDLKAMTILLKLVWDDFFLIEEEDMLLVLQAACMLLFEKVKLLMIHRLTMILSIKNCVQVWFVTEQLDLKPLYLKAKNLALIEFHEINRSDSVIELNLKQLHNYLSQTSLVCDCEMIIFNTLMRWWTVNSLKKEQWILPFGKPSDRTNVFLCLLACLDFSRLTADDLKQMSAYPDIKNDEKIVGILKCIIDLKDDIDVSCDDNVSMWEAKKFLNCKPRARHQVPLILAHTLNDIWHVDIVVTTFDDKDVLIDTEELESINGHQVIGYKQFLVLFGHKFCDEGWEFWVYDSIREEWELKCIFTGRGIDYLKSCIVGSLLYIIMVQPCSDVKDSMESYNFINDSWSNEGFLPCKAGSVESCEFNNKLCLLSVYNKCVYIFSNESWQTLKICDSSELISKSRNGICFFSYQNHLYIIGSTLIKMAVVDQELLIVDNIVLKSSIQHSYFDSLISGDVLYILYEDHSLNLILQKFDMINKNVEYIFQLSIEELESKFKDGTEMISTFLIGFQSHDFLAANSFVTNLN